MFLLRLVLSIVLLPFLILAYILRFIFIILSVTGERILTFIAGLLVLVGIITLGGGIFGAGGDIGAGIGALVVAAVVFFIPKVIDFLADLMDSAIDWIKSMTCCGY